MPENARITSLEALESFRNSLIVYLEKAARAVEEMDDEVVRTRLWLQNDRRLHWENQVHLLTTELDLKQQELFSARLSDSQGDILVARKAVQKIQAALDNAMSKLGLIKQYNRQFENRIAPMAKQVEKARCFLTNDMRTAVAGLTRTITTLKAYADIRPAGETATAVAPPAPASEPARNPTTTGGQP